MPLTLLINILPSTGSTVLYGSYRCLLLLKIAFQFTVLFTNMLVSDYYVSRVNIGVFCHTPGIAVARSIPRKAALMMLFTGQPITAQGTFSFNRNYSVDVICSYCMRATCQHLIKFSAKGRS